MAMGAAASPVPTLLTKRLESNTKPAWSWPSGTYPGFHFDGVTLLASEPFCGFLYYREKFLDYAEERKKKLVADKKNEEKTHTRLTTQVSVREPDTAADTDPETEIKTLTYHIEKLFSFIDEQYLHEMDLEKARWASSSPVCTYDWAWMLFAPGKMVYETHTIGSAVMRAYKVKSFSFDGLFSVSADNSPVPLLKRVCPIDARSPLESITAIYVQILYREHDGRYWQMRKKEFVLHRFKGGKPICELAICPEAYYSDPQGTIRSELIQRGRLYHSLSTRRQINYSGHSLSGIGRQIDSRIMVDSETYNYDPRLAGITSSRDPMGGYDYTGRVADETHQMYGLADPVGDYSDEDSDDDNPGNIANANRQRQDIYSPPDPYGYGGGGLFGDSRRTRPSSEQKKVLSNSKPLSDRHYMICTAEIPAYILKDRVWSDLAVQSISECRYQESLIGELQMTVEARRLIQALSHNYAFAPKMGTAFSGLESGPEERWTSDFISSKSGGQIILLHGKPGVGKTTTAECIAELTKRPLLTITCGDLGSEPREIQAELTRWLRLSRLWDAVVLLDEADVFLEARLPGEIVRNSIVSIFLRELEYYQGLMFLTTNRIGRFDEAILSRIHVVLHLPNLDNDDRWKIWETSFNKVFDERPDIDVGQMLMSYAWNDSYIQSLKWNGREIRIAFNTMIALAQWDAKQNNAYTRDGKVEVKVQHLKEVAKMSENFKTYLS